MSGQGAGQGNPGRGRPEERRGARRDSGQGPSPGARGDSGQGPSLEDPSQWFALGRGRALIPNRGTPSHRAQAGANVQRSTDIMASLSSAARGRPYPDPAIVASGIGRGFVTIEDPENGQSLARSSALEPVFIVPRHPAGQMVPQGNVPIIGLDSGQGPSSGPSPVGAGAGQDSGQGPRTAPVPKAGGEVGVAGAGQDSGQGPRTVPVGVGVAGAGQDSGQGPRTVPVPPAQGLPVERSGQGPSLDLGTTGGAKAGRTSGQGPSSVPVPGPGLAREEANRELPGPRSQQPVGQGQGHSSAGQRQDTGHSPTIRSEGQGWVGQNVARSARRSRQSYACLDRRCSSRFGDTMARNAHYVQGHLQESYYDTLQDLYVLARLLRLEGDPLEALREFAQHRRVAAAFQSGPPGRTWQNHCEGFAREAGLRVMKPEHWVALQDGNVHHESLLIIPRIHAGLVNCLTREAYLHFREHREGTTQARPQEPEAAASEPGPSSPTLHVPPTVQEEPEVVAPPPSKPISRPSTPEMVEVDTRPLVDSPPATQPSDMEQATATPFDITQFGLNPANWPPLPVMPQPMGAAMMAALPALEVVDAHWHPDRISPPLGPYAMQGPLGLFLAGDIRQQDTHVRLVGGVAVYCDLTNPPTHIIDLGWVTARGIHPHCISPGDDVVSMAVCLVATCLASRWAIGEVGLDFSRGTEAHHAAQHSFLSEVVGQRQTQPLVIHLRGNSQDPHSSRPLHLLLEIFRDRGLPHYTPVQLHCFQGTVEEVNLALRSRHFILFQCWRIGGVGLPSSTRGDSSHSG